MLWEHMFFLKVDRSMEKLETHMEKVQCYGRHGRQSIAEGVLRRIAAGRWLQAEKLRQVKHFPSEARE